MGAEQQAALIQAYIRADSQMRERVLALVLQMFTGLGSWRGEDVDRFVSAAVPVVLGAQRQVGSLTDAYIRTLLSDMLGGTVRASGAAPSTGATLRNGTEPAEVYARPLRTVWRALAEGKGLDEALSVARLRLGQIVTTDLQLAKTHAARSVMSADGRVVGYRRVLTGVKTCGICVVASTQRYHRQDLMPIHPGCVPEGARVSADGVLAVSRRWYAGELAIIRTADGDEVTVTPNHPVLTDQGWVPGHLVCEGDHVLRSKRSDRVVGRGPHESKGPVLAEDVWRAVGVSRLVRVPSAAQDFHGDGADGEVEIVRPDGYLSPIGSVSFAQPIRERTLVAGHGGWIPLSTGSELAPGFPRGSTSAVGLVSGGDLGKPGFRGHLCGAHQASVRSAARRYALTGEHEPNGRPFRTVFMGYRQLGHAAGVIPDDLAVGQVPPGSSTGRFDPPAVEFTGQGRAAYADLGRRLLDRLAGQVELDRVVEIRRVDYSGHVFNLHTVEGWYQSNNHIISNCDCGIAPIIGTTDPGHVLDAGLLDQAHAAIADRFGVSAASGRGPLDYRDVLVTHEHGEIGPVLSRKGDAFTGPSDLH